MAIRSLLASMCTTDLVAHSSNGFPAPTGRSFLDFFAGRDAEDPRRYRRFVGESSQCAGICACRLQPLSGDLCEKVLWLTARKSQNKDGVSRIGFTKKHTLVPEAGGKMASDAATAAAKDRTICLTSYALLAGPDQFKIAVRGARTAICE